MLLIKLVFYVQIDNSFSHGSASCNYLGSKNKVSLGLNSALQKGSLNFMCHSLFTVCIE